MFQTPSSRLIKCLWSSAWCVAMLFTDDMSHTTRRMLINPSKSASKYQCGPSIIFTGDDSSKECCSKNLPCRLKEFGGTMSA